MATSDSVMLNAVGPHQGYGQPFAGAYTNVYGTQPGSQVAQDQYWKTLERGYGNQSQQLVRDAFGKMKTGIFGDEYDWSSAISFDPATGEYKLDLKEIPLGQRSGADTKQAIAKEGERMLAALPTSCYLVALQVTGRAMTSEQLATFLQARANDGRDVAFCIGGPDGLAQSVDARAELKWSLSALTLPHALARIVVAEALYRAVSIVKGHPYHRA